MRTVIIKDQVLGGGTTNEFSLDFLKERIDVRELIRSRVFQEVRDFNVEHKTDSQRTFRGLVEPTDAEKTLNGYRLKGPPREISWEEQFDRAIKAFEGNQIIVLVNNKQCESLDEQIEIRPDTVVTFLRLTQLVGG